MIDSCANRPVTTYSYFIALARDIRAAIEPVIEMVAEAARHINSQMQVLLRQIAEYHRVRNLQRQYSQGRRQWARPAAEIKYGATPTQIQELPAKRWWNKSLPAPPTRFKTVACAKKLGSWVALTTIASAWATVVGIHVTKLWPF